MTDDLQTPDGPIGSDLLKEDPSFADIVVQFVEGLSNRLATMEEALNTSDFQALRVAAHQLKGSRSDARNGALRLRCQVCRRPGG